MARADLPALTASYFFYGMWDARFLALLLTTTVVDYFGALAIAGGRQPAAKITGIGLLPLSWLLAVSLFFSAHAAVDKVDSFLPRQFSRSPMARFTICFGGCRRRNSAAPF